MNRKLKKCLSILLIMSMFSVKVFGLENFEMSVAKHLYQNRTPEQLEQLNDNTIKINEIDDLVNMYNATVRNNWNNYEANKTKDDVYNDYVDAYNTLDALAGSAESDVQAAMYRAQADAMLMNANNNVVDSNINYLNYYIVEKNIVLSTKISFINYFKNVLELQLSTALLNEAERKEKTAKNNHNAGLITKVEYLNAKKEVETAKSNKMIKTSLVTNSKNNILINCGKNITDDIVFEEPIAITDVEIDSINNLLDYDKAFNNNYQYDIYKRQYENAMTDEMKKQNKIYVDSAKNYIITDVEKKYNDLIDARVNYKNNIEIYNHKLKQNEQSANQYKNGSISLSDYNSVLVDAETARLNMEISKYDILIAYENYNAVVNGLASAGNQ